MSYPKKPDWKEAVAWRRGPLGTLHAQWRDEDEGYAACSPTPLSGPDEGFLGDACPRCIAMARSVYASAREVAHSDAFLGRPLSECQAKLRSLHPALEVSVRVLQSWWPDMGDDAAQKQLSRAAAAGWLERVGFGVYRRRVTP